MGAYNRGYMWRPSRVKWTLVDDSHPRFNRYLCSAGYIEAFLKGINPDTERPFGQAYPVSMSDYNKILSRDTKIVDNMRRKEKERA